MKISQFITELGVVNLHIVLNDTSLINKNGNHFYLENLNFEINIYEFIPVYPAEREVNELTSIGWVFFIKKLNDLDTKFEIICELDPFEKVQSSIETGEGLDSILITSYNHSMSIGTEGVDALIQRMSSNDFLPSRLLDNEVIKPEKIVSLYDLKILINIPPLLTNETVYFQCIVASGSQDTTTETNIMVDQSKNNIMKLLNIPLPSGLSPPPHSTE